MQQKTGRPVQFEITERTRVALASWIHHQRRCAADFTIRYLVAEVDDALEIAEQTDV